jgi:flavin reductase (NADH)/cob(II)yrinic acid a,c-diamide reductase
MFARREAIKGAGTVSAGDESGGDRSVEEHFREAFTRLAATVTVLTYRDGAGRAAGMTATSVCSLSMDPLSVLACVNRSTKSHDEIAASGRFGVNLLSREQQEIAAFCSRPGADKSLPPEWLAEGDGTPALVIALAHLDCSVARSYEESTHSIFIGHVTKVRLGDATEPLLYCNREYRNLAAAKAEAMESVWERIAFSDLC